MEINNKINILYIHGMGGGGDSRIPSILRENVNSYIPKGDGRRINVVVRTYDFDPEIASAQISSWVDELKPALVMGESLGSVHAIRVKGVPHILVSPSLNAPLYLGYLAFLALIPGVTQLLDYIYKPKSGDRQRLHFSFRILRKYRRHRSLAIANTPAHASGDYFFAFFGDMDHYRKSGIVNINTWKRYFGDSFQTYPGTHFMEAEFIHSLLIPKILSVLSFRDMP